jgi:glycosyltransferase involved in cell wall biosynthesis
MTRLHDPQLRARLSAAALEEVRRYEPGVVAAQLHELYDAVAARRHARR